jgi:hypothetical protein
MKRIGSLVALSLVALAVTSATAWAASPQINVDLATNDGFLDPYFSVHFNGSGFAPFEQFTTTTSFHAYVVKRCSDGSRVSLDLGTTSEQSGPWTADTGQVRRAALLFAYYTGPAPACPSGTTASQYQEFFDHVTVDDVTDGVSTTSPTLFHERLPL